MLILLIFLSISVLLLLTAEKYVALNSQNKIALYIPGLAKLVASSIFVCFFYYYAPKLDIFGKSIFIAFSFSFLGDVLLIPKSKNQYFVAGIAAFAIAHLAFSYAFIQLPINLLNFLLSAVISCVAGAAVYLWLRPHLQRKYRIMVPSYLIIIIIMVTTGISAGITAGLRVGINSPIMWIASGSLIFAISDIFVARNRFIKPKLINRLVGLPLYYTAQIMTGYGAIQVLTL